MREGTIYRQHGPGAGIVIAAAAAEHPSEPSISFSLRCESMEVV